MKKILFFLPFLLLSACVSAPVSAPQVVVYDFGLPSARIVAKDAWASLALEVKSSSWGDSSSVGYRLAYENPLKRRGYAGSRWVGAPAALIDQQLKQQLGAMSAAGRSATECVLLVELQEFSQIFDSPQQSRGVLQVRASLIDKKRSLLSRRLFIIEKLAASADAHGGVLALAAASEALGLQLAAWLDEPEMRNPAASCR